jgi:branched-subunit amino acid aminotransferase/4-amino-4-deoxychorismate lyase
MGTSVVQDLDLRIITTLKSILFNVEDVRQGFPVVKEWERANKKLLALHRRRLSAAAQACSWRDVCLQLQSDDAGGLLEEEVEKVTARHAQPGREMIRDIRVRVLIDSKGSIQCESVPMGDDKGLDSLKTDPFPNLPPNGPPPSLSREARFSLVSVDSAPTSPTLYTSHKTTHRHPYDAARARAGISKCLPSDREVLLFNEEGQVMEASLCTAYFYRNGQWVVPPSAAGGMLSVTKLLATDVGFCTEAMIPLDSVADGETIWLSNALRGFFLGCVVRPT